MGRLLSALLVSLVLTLPTLAHADADLGEDLIRLKDGGMLRGTIVALEPNKEATIVIGGKEKTIPWSKISKVEQGKYKDQKAEKDEDDEDDEEEDTPKPKKKKKKKKVAREEEEELTEPEPGAPRVHIAATYPDVSLHRVEEVISVVSSNGTATGYIKHDICTAPCDIVVDGRKKGKFYFAAPTMVPSAHFQLKDYDGEIEARVRGGNLRLRLGGVFAVILGGIAVVPGASLLVVGLSGSGETSRDFAVAGGITFAVGTAALVGGIFMIRGSKTTFEIVPRTTESAGIRFENGVLRF